MHQRLTHPPDANVSPYILALREELQTGKMKKLGSFGLGDLDVEVRQGRDSVWCFIRREGRGGLALRTMHASGAEYSCRKVAAEEGEALRVEASSVVGTHVLSFTSSEAALHRLRVVTRFTPATSMRVPYLPRDLYALDGNDDPSRAEGNVEAAQRGTTSGILYLRFREPAFGSVLYFQNLTALNRYFLATGTKPDGVVGGAWPELGYQPPTPETQDAGEGGVLEAGQEYVLSDAIIVLRDWAADDEQEMARQFLQMLGTAYQALDLPHVEYRDWAGRAERTLADLQTWEQARRREYGDLYLMPYPDGEYPDSMVQLSVVQALHEYGIWRGEPVPIEAELMKRVHRFYDPKFKTLRRYLPNVGEEQGKDPDAVDSWYLYHPMLNLGRLALRGNEEAKELLLKSIDYGIEAAHHFDYAWPIMYKIQDFSVITKTRGGRAVRSNGRWGDLCLRHAAVLRAHGRRPLHSGSSEGDRQGKRATLRSALSGEPHGLGCGGVPALVAHHGQQDLPGAKLRISSRVLPQRADLAVAHRHRAALRPLHGGDLPSRCSVHRNVRVLRKLRRV